MPRQITSHSLIQRLLRALPGLGLITLLNLVFLCVPLSIAHSSADCRCQQLGLELNRLTQGAGDVRELAPGTAIERELAGGESLYYRITLQSHHYVRVRVHSLGINVVLTLLGPDGKKLEEVDTPNSTYGQKSIMRVAESAGDYILQVHAPERDVVSGRCLVDIPRLLPVTEQNRSLIIADRATAEGWRLHEIGTEEALREAIKRFQEALPHWHAVGDRVEEATTFMYLGEVNYNLSEYQEALKAYEQALPLWKAANNYVGEGWALNNIGDIYSSFGEKQKALDSFLRSLRA